MCGNCDSALSKIRVRAAPRVAVESVYDSLHDANGCSKGGVLCACVVYAKFHIRFDVVMLNIS